MYKIHGLVLFSDFDFTLCYRTLLAFRRFNPPYLKTQTIKYQKVDWCDFLWYFPLITLHIKRFFVKWKIAELYRIWNLLKYVCQQALMWHPDRVLGHLPSCCVGQKIHQFTENMCYWHVLLTSQNSNTLFQNQKNFELI